MSKPLLVAKAKGKWALIALCLVPGCTEKRRTVTSIIQHINEEH